VNDKDCRKAGQPLTKFTFYETYFINWPTYGLGLPKESLEVKRSSVKANKKPNCNLAELPFSMKTFDHLDVDIYFLISAFRKNNLISTFFIFI
jgi:hypothetical protein